MSKHAKCLAWVQLSFVDKTECKTVLLPNYWSCSLMAKSCSKTRQFPSVLQSSESRALASFICFSNPFKVLRKLLGCLFYLCSISETCNNSSKTNELLLIFSLTEPCPTVLVFI